MGHRILILGAGTAGTVMANRLRKSYSEEEATITIVDKDDRHLYQPGLLYIPFGLYTPEQIVKSRPQQVRKGVDYIQQPIDHVDVENDCVYLEGGRKLEYDLLIVATGTRVIPEETEGLTGPGWQEKMFDFYTFDSAVALSKKLATWEGGTLVVNIVDMPIKCPVAPLEFAFLSDWFLHERGIRDKCDIKYVTPLDGAFTKPMASKAFGDLLEQKGVTIVPDFNTGEVDGPAGKLKSFDEKEVDFDLLVTIPVHGGAEFVGRSPGLGDELDFVKVDNSTLQAEVKPNVFAIGDATNVPTSKAGSVAHFMAEVLSENVHLHLAGKPLKSDFDGHANCFIETGFKKGILIDFNYKIEPLPGGFPFGAGPFTLLKESRRNHWGKLAFKWFYWNVILPGKDAPFVGHEMLMRGKRPPSDWKAPVG